MKAVNKKYMITIITILVVIEICTMFLMYKSLSNKDIELENVSLKEIEDNKMLAIMLEQDDGTYEESETWPVEGYVYDESKSGCMDSEGNKIEDALTYDSETNIASVETGNTAYCYLYFKLPLCVLASDSTVEGGLEGAKYNCKVDPDKDRYTFYLIDNNEDGTSDLIMNANINASGEAVIPEVTEDTGMVAWYADEGNNIHGPVTAMTYLYNATKSWTNIEPVSYEYNDKEAQTSEYGYTSFKSTNGIAVITASDGTSTTIGTTSEPLRARMPIYSSDAEVLDKTSTNGFLYNNLDSEWINGPYGYWTLSSSSGNSSNAWYVDSGGYVYYNYVDDVGFFGVRPVITVTL